MMQGIIDSHIHRYPEHIIADPQGWAAANGEPYWAKMVAPDGLQDWADRGRLLRDMDDAGVEKAVIQGWYWQRQENCVELNHWHVRWLNEDPDRFIVLASVQPAAGRVAVEDLKRALDEGCTGVGELHPWAQGWSLNDRVWEEIAAMCSERGFPVCFHATETVGRDYTGKLDTPLAEYMALARRFPDLKIVLAHWGGGLPFFMLNRWTAKQLKNVYFDTAASPLLYDARVWKNAVEMAGPTHVLYGTDYPLRVYPSKQSAADMLMLRDEAIGALPEDARIAVMRENALRVYGG